MKYDGERNQIKFIMRICHHRLRILIILAISGILFSYFYVPRDLVYLLLAGIIPTIVQTSFSFGSYFNLHKKVKVVSIFGIISSI
ncbi:MAG: hypothetical protein ORN26_02695, partial [Candidatus Pacebacteria bacterium]|nr:hypothetical protein [Candidatus Paceibacterota bacterium]